MSKLKLMRLKRNYSIKKLAEISGICRETIRRIESGKYSYIQDITLYKLAKALNCNMKDITN